MTGHGDRWIKRTTTGCVALLALIAGTVSYLHMRTLVGANGQPGWVAALTPLSVDGMIVAASTTLLAESRSGSRGGALPWSLLVIGSVASLVANVAVAQPTLAGRLVAAWPSFALICSYELLMRNVRRNAVGKPTSVAKPAASLRPGEAMRAASRGATRRRHTGQRAGGRALQREAWQWALANRAADGSLPTGKAIADQYGRHERWGRLVKRHGQTGGIDTTMAMDDAA